MVKVGRVVVRVCDTVVLVHVRVLAVDRRIVDMPVVAIVVTMRVLVKHSLVNVRVGVLLG